ncbi:MAG: aminotransferase class III-fold pyridoxal phosphate-dependent enzyme [Planctomycetes bacterium]|nr:aminotransferase class III-fold pyridoxal phosphate-dependent enzyme [Planctomycetota bacterium]
MRFDRSLELYEEARRLIPGGSQTNSKRPQHYAYGAYPIYAKHAQGCRIEDVDGNRFIDLTMAFGPIVLGYGYPRVQEAIRRQLEHGTIAGLMFEAEVEAARIFTETVPCAEMVRFLKGGGEATAAAARIARAFTGRELILNSGYRGWPDVWAAAHPLSKGVPSVLKETIRNFPFNDIPRLDRLLNEHKSQVAAVILEIPAVEPHDGYLQAVRDLAHKHGALLIMDEVVTGFRLAPGGAQERYGVIPDLACFAKAMANGMPVSAVAGRADVMKVAEDLLITVTYGGEALSLAACVATVSELRERPVNEHLWSVGAELRDGLNASAQRHGVPFESTGPAPMPLMRFDLADKSEADRVWTFFLQEMAARGVLMRRGGWNLVTYSHTREDIRIVLGAADQVFGALKPLLGSPQLARALKTTEVGSVAAGAVRSFVKEPA